MRIAVAILARTLDEFHKQLESIKDFAYAIQIDIADGVFVDNTTVPLSSLLELPSDKAYEIHLMVKSPKEYIPDCVRLGARAVIVHAESNDIDDTLGEVRRRGMLAILALNHETALDSIRIEKVDGVQIMSVNPGFQGNEFIPKALDRVKDIRAQYPDLLIEMDGGIKKENIAQVVTAGVDVANVGSAIIDAANPRQSWDELHQAAGIDPVRS